MATQQAPLSSAVLDRELSRIGDWWLRHAIDEQGGGFFGEIRDDGTPVAGANKSIILNTRILWFFSEAFRVTGEDRYHDAAVRAFDYIAWNFVDRKHGGLMWELDAAGAVVSDRKQTYAQAFGIFAFSAYYRISSEPLAITLAEQLFQLVENKCADTKHGGYFEGFSRDWRPLTDMRLSEVDDNFPKSMNNHLHVLEAYTTLYSVKKDPAVSAALRGLLDVFAERIVRSNGAMILFFTEEWETASEVISCGHDIEASWLLLEAAETLDDADVLTKTRKLASTMSERCLLKGLCDPGYVINEINEDGAFDLSSPWWVQAEALVGFLWAHKQRSEPQYLEAARTVWAFIQDQHIDHELGEWFWGARKDCSSEHRSYKAGSWKGPYHNGRAMMESARIMRDLERLPALARETGVRT